MAGILKANEVQLGDNADATKNFVLRTNVDGTLTLARGNVGATTQDILTVNALGRISTLDPSRVFVGGHNGSGSTNTFIRRFTSVFANVGSDITYNDSATLGATFTINATGVYAISYTDQHSVANDHGITRNATPTLNISQVTDATKLAHCTNTANYASCAAWTGYLVAGDVIRAHAASNASGTDPNRTRFSIVRVA